MGLRMDFELSEELKMIQSLARDFVVSELKPLERDLLGRSADLSDARASVTSEVEAGLIDKARAAGLWGASVPEEFGGAGLGTLANCVIEEELAQTIVPFDLGDVTPILFDCDQNQRARYLTPALNHEKAVYVALAEPGRPEVNAMRAAARKDTGGYVLNGVKVSLARQREDYCAVVFAVAGRDRSPTCFLVDAGSIGFDLQVLGHSTTGKASMLLTFKECPAPEANRIGAEGKAFSLGRKWLPSRRIVRGARTVGTAERLLQEASTRAQTTKSFGRDVSERPSIRAAVADIVTEIHACRLLVYEAALRADDGKSITNESAMVKLFASRMLKSVNDKVAHIYGGPGAITGQGTCVTMPYVGDWSPDELQADILSRQILKGLKI